MEKVVAEIRVPSEYTVDVRRNPYGPQEIITVREKTPVEEADEAVRINTGFQTYNTVDSFAPKEPDVVATFERTGISYRVLRNGTVECEGIFGPGWSESFSFASDAPLANLLEALDGVDLVADYFVKDGAIYCHDPSDPVLSAFNEYTIGETLKPFLSTFQHRFKDGPLDWNPPVEEEEDEPEEQEDEGVVATFSHMGVDYQILDDGEIRLPIGSSWCKSSDFAPHRPFSRLLEAIAGNEIPCFVGGCTQEPIYLTREGAKHSEFTVSNNTIWQLDGNRTIEEAMTTLLKCFENADGVVELS